MSAEAAFLATLAENPADDTTRLVYADWLDEHGEASKAEYLRLVVGVVPRFHAAESDPPETARGQALAGELDRDWRVAAAARFAVVFYGQGPTDKISAIKLVREVTGFGLAEAKRFVESPPARLPGRFVLEDAVELRTRLRRVDSVRVEVHPGELDPVPHVATYSVYAYFHNRDWDWAEEVEETDLTRTARRGFCEFLGRALKSPVERIMGLHDVDGSVPLGQEMTAAEYAARMLEWQSLLPPSDPDRGWDIYLSTACRASPAPPANRG